MRTATNIWSMRRTTEKEVHIMATCFGNFSTSRFIYLEPSIVDRSNVASGRKFVIADKAYEPASPAEWRVSVM